MSTAKLIYDLVEKIGCDENLKTFDLIELLEKSMIWYKEKEAATTKIQSVWRSYQVRKA